MRVKQEVSVVVVSVVLSVLVLVSAVLSVVVVLSVVLSCVVVLSVVVVSAMLTCLSSAKNCGEARARTSATKSCGETCTAQRELIDSSTIVGGQDCQRAGEGSAML